MKFGMAGGGTTDDLRGGSPRVESRGRAGTVSGGRSPQELKYFKSITRKFYAFWG